MGLKKWRRRQILLTFSSFQSRQWQFLPNTNLKRTFRYFFDGGGGEGRQTGAGVRARKPGPQA